MSMSVRVITLRFDELLGGFDDTPVQELIKDVVSLREYFFVKNTTPYLTLIVTYDLAAVPPPPVAKP